MKKNITAIALSGALTLTLLTPAFAANTLSFSDVPATHWAYAAITDMTEKEMFQGTTPAVNGVGTFSPDNDMSRAAFITVIVRYLYPDEIKPVAAGQKWYEPYTAVARVHGIIRDGELSDMDGAMLRQEMATVLVRAADLQQKEVGELVDTSEIADYDTIENTYKQDVRKCFSYGMIKGIDSKGTFAPLGKMNRAQAATVVYRLIGVGLSDASNGKPEESSKPETKPEETTKPETKPEEKPTHQHKFSSKVIAPTTTSQGYTEYTCECGYSYKDNYTDKLVEKPETGWTNTGGEASGSDNVTVTGGTAGQLVPDDTLAAWNLTRPASRVNGGDWKTYNGFLFDAYHRYFVSGGIGQNAEDAGTFAKVSDTSGGFEVEVFEWRKSYASSSSTNRCLNMVMEAFYYACGDRDVAYALWSWIDAANINNGANTDDYGFTDVSVTNRGAIVTKNGINIEIDESTSGVTVLRFN